MAKRSSRISDYDLAVRALDSGRTEVNEFLYDHTPGRNTQEGLSSRKKLIKKLEKYRNPHYMEQYHKDYLYIQTKLEGIIPFKWKRAQKTLWYNHVLPKILKNEPVRIYLLKARQIGFSTQIEGIGTALSCLFSDFRSSVVAHDKNTSAKIHNMTKLFYKKLSTDFKPARKKSNRYELELANPNEDEELGLESSFTVNTAQNLHMGAGSTYRFMHLSELARYEEVNAQAEDALITLFQTTPRTGGTFIFIETTAYGEGLGKRVWDNEDNGFEKVFIPWIADDDYTLPIPLKSDELMRDDKDKYGNEVQAREDIIRELINWYPEECEDSEWLKHESLCRLAWRREYIDEQCWGKLELFKQEYPITPEEAFRITGRCVFSTYVLTTLKSESENKESEQYEYIPKGINKLGHFDKNDTGHLKIYKQPSPNEFYYIGVDVGAGMRDGDYSVAQVFNHRFQQCAVFRDIIEPNFFSYPIVTLAKIYNDAKIIPEANSMGVGTIDKIVTDLRYTNVYVRTKINNIEGGISKEWGFYTSSKTKDLLVNNGRQLISNRTLRLYDYDTIHEFLNFVFTMTTSGRIVMQASPGVHDDMVMSTLLAIYDIEDEDTLIERKEQEVPMYSVEWYAQQMDEQESNYDNFGDVGGF